ncbi:Arsenate reductase [Alloactinosynnema sp. L-07]|uniref:ArsC/Spx/MgsR family protein n=1 Tax=Alloactinosynnema sp. L-07 TaxID=1653480 RepID=UPI00065EF0B1|nr:ArsC/Spx/MgsR family protein [Alloactinosynnema sp. L-07]CRK61752.1 Arsenate reductase [Alloactinosynnema sp. L-07]
MEIWHNPRCTKSRAALEVLDGSVTVRRYLDEPPTAAELEQVLVKLDLQPWDITRLKEPLAKELGLADLPRERTKWIDVLAANPSLIERPIVIHDDGHAAIVRSQEALDALISQNRK